MKDRKVGICLKVQSGTSRTLSEIHTAVLPRVSAGSVVLPQDRPLATPLNSAFCIRQKPQCRNAE